MIAFRLLLVAIFFGISAYTLPVVLNHGMGLLSIFFADIAAMAWPGQFNVDFMCFLLLSALWVAWRHHFSASGLLLGLLAFFGGALFLSAYLFIHSFKVDNRVDALLLGTTRASKSASAQG